MRISTKLALASVSLISLTTPVYAAETAAAAAADATNKDGDAQIVVTGTLIRGTQATGSQTLTRDAKAIAEVAAISTNALLSSIPQLGNFNASPEGNPRGLTAVSTIVRPNLRGFPSTNATSGALTLIMLDGLRMTPVGSNSSSVDPDIIPAAILTGLDIVTDGGSSLYGADAVAGVMNFRTMKTFDGVKIDGNFGFGDRIKGFHQWDGSVTAGKSWSTGNAYVSVSHADRNEILNKQTAWANGKVYSAAGVVKLTSTTCNTPQVTAMRYAWIPSYNVWTNNPLAGAGPVALGTGCDTVLDASYLPSLKRTNVFASVSNSFSDTVDLRITSYWMKRELGVSQYDLGYTSKATTPSAPSTPGTAAGQTYDFPQGIGFALGPNSSYHNTPNKIAIETWGVTPELTVKLSSSWSLRTSMHYGRSNNATHFVGLNTAAIDTYVTAGQIVPTNIAAATSAVVADITNWETAQDTTHELLMFKSVADGSLFALPGGDAKVAAGVEYDFNKDATRIYTGKQGVLGGLPYASVSRNVKSVFGELHLPVTSFAELAGSIRYDKYSDFGDTTNPNIGLTLKPTSWLKVYGHWGTSYNAPTPYDNLGIGLGRAGQNYVTTRPTIAVGKTDNLSGTYFIVLTGGSPAGVKPQTSKSWALGFDATPFTGLNFGVEFYSIDLKNAIGNLNPANSNTYNTNPSLYIYNNELTANNNALFTQIMGQLANGAAITAQVGGAAGVAILVDTRTSNLNAAKVEGLDMHLNYETDTTFGHVSITNSATYSTRARITGGGAITNELAHGQPRLNLAAGLGLRTEGGYSAKVTVNYSGKYHDNNLNNLSLEQDVNPFIVTNLNVGYDFAKSGGFLKGTAVRLNIDNVFNVSPQSVLRLNTNANAFNGWTLGRVIKLGFTEKF